MSIPSFPYFRDVGIKGILDVSQPLSHQSIDLFRGVVVDKMTSVLNVLDLQVSGECFLYGLCETHTQGRVIFPPDQEDWHGVVEVKLDTPTDLL